MSESDDEQLKSVYAHFGLAIYMNQVLKHGIANALLVLELLPRAPFVATSEAWATQVESFYEMQFKRTLGNLVRRLREVAAVPSDLEDLLEKALNKRNWLSHHYFRERATSLLSVRGRNAMIAELQEARDLFKAADIALDVVVKPIKEQYGYTEEYMKKFEAEIRNEAGGGD